MRMRRSVDSVFKRLINGSRCTVTASAKLQRYSFHTTSRLLVIKPFVLADIGEGIREVQIIQWFVQPGARVEQFDKICEVASDKAIVEITSRFDGVIKKLHYEPDAMAQVGKPLCDIDIQGDIDPADEKLITPDSDGPHSEQSKSASTKVPAENPSSNAAMSRQENGSQKSAHLATPAVRALLKEHNLDIADISGTGREGRVLKEDVQSHLNSQPTKKTTSSTATVPPPRPKSSPNTETTVPMTPIQAAMFKAMTRSLSIPHFLYSDEVDLTNLSFLRTAINTSSTSPTPKLSYLPYIIKAVSLTLDKYPILNATLSPHTPGSILTLLHRSSHNIGIAIDTPSGLLVPVLKNAQSLSILEIAQHIAYFQSLATSGKLSSHPELLSGGTLTISNVGNIGGGVLSPVLVEGQSAILGIGRAREVPRFASRDVGDERIERRLMATFSWTADHRVLDGATVARFAERVAGLLREPGRMVLEMR